MCQGCDARELDDAPAARGRPHPAGPAVTAAGAVSGCLAIAAADPATPGGPIPVCPTKALFGVPCPICGTARAIAALVHGDPAAALRYNALAVAAIGLAIWAWAAWAAAAAGARPFTWTGSARAWWAIGAAVAAWAVVRLLPFGPFAALGAWVL